MHALYRYVIAVDLLLSGITPKPLADQEDLHTSIKRLQALMGTAREYVSDVLVRANRLCGLSCACCSNDLAFAIFRTRTASVHCIRSN